jgi:predicted phage terminase large subunit-like protein
VQGVVTGKGANYIIIDDPMKAIDAQSDPARNQVFDWVKTALMSRFDRPKEGRMIVIMQRLHMDDLLGRLRDEGNWEVLEMPGEGVERTTYDLGSGERWDFQPGECLYPEVFDTQALAQQQYDLGESAYNAQILQRPAPPGGMLFKVKHFQRYDKPPTHFERIVQSWDPAIVDHADAAFTVCTTWGINGHKLYLLDVFRKRVEFYQIEKAILSMREKFSAQQIILEVSGVGTAIGDALLKQDQARRWLNPVAPPLGKVERALAQTPKIERRRVYLPEAAPWLETFEREVAEFPFSKFADQVDSMVHFLGALDSRNQVTRDLAAFRDWPKNAF